MSARHADARRAGRSTRLGISSRSSARALSPSAAAMSLCESAADAGCRRRRPWRSSLARRAHHARTFSGPSRALLLCSCLHGAAAGARGGGLLAFCLLDTRERVPQPTEGMTVSSTGGSSTGGVGFLGLLLLAFIILKLCGVIEWSWWWVLAPFWIPFGFAVAFLLMYAVFLCIEHHCWTRKRRRIQP